MKENNELKWFLIRGFFLCLLFVACSQTLINILYNYIVYPWLSDTMKINLFITKVSSGESLATLGKGVLWLLGRGLAGMLPAGVREPFWELADDWAGKHIVTQMLNQTVSMNRTQQGIYLAGVLVISLLLMLGLLLPYITAILGFSYVITKKVAELNKARQREREEYDRRRNLLLSDVAHDLKTPMTMVSGYASALAEGQVLEPEKQQEYLKVIYNKSMQMSGLITLLFEYVKLDSEGFTLKKTKEDMTELLRESVAALYADFEEKEMEVRIEIPEEPVYLEIDRVQFQRSVNNLLNNALKHNPPKTSVGVIMKTEEDVLEIRICDNGSRIPEETAGHIFDPFVMGDESRNSKGGSGLGLSIVQKVISMHGGEIMLCQDLPGEYEKAFVVKLKVEEE